MSRDQMIGNGHDDSVSQVVNAPSAVDLEANERLAHDNGTAPTSPRAKIQPTIESIQRCLDHIREGFSRWDEDYIKGPGLYIAVVASDSIDDCADPMGDNRWPVEVNRNVHEDRERFLETARDVAAHQDGAVVVHANGTIEEQMVRFHTAADDTSGHMISTPEYDDWMGSRHMSAVEISARDDVLATLTLSEENGRVTVFRDGAVVESSPRSGTTAADRNQEQSV